MSDLAGKTILVVEDQFMIAMELEDAIQDLGGLVAGPYTSGANALAFIASGSKLDGAILDLHVDDGPVYPVAEALRKVGVPFIFATGQTDSHIPSRYDDVTRIAKPASPASILAAIVFCMES